MVTIRYKAYDFLLMFYSNYMALSRVVPEIFNVEKYRDLEIPVKSRAQRLKFLSPYIRPFGLTESDQIWHGNTYGEAVCF